PRPLPTRRSSDLGGGGPDLRFRGIIDEVRIYKALPDSELIAILACADSLERIAAIPPRQRTKGQRLKMLNAFLEEGAPAPLQRWGMELRRRKEPKEQREAG